MLPLLIVHGSGNNSGTLITQSEQQNKLISHNLETIKIGTEHKLLYALQFDNKCR